MDKNEKALAGGPKPQRRLKMIMMIIMIMMVMIMMVVMIRMMILMMMMIMMTKPHDDDDDIDDDSDHKNDSYTAAGAAPDASVPCSLFLALWSSTVRHGGVGENGTRLIV